MELKDYITGIGILLSAALVVGDWFFTRRKDREQEKFRLRQSRLAELVKDFLVVDEVLLRTSGKVDTDPEFIKYWIKLAGLMYLYGAEEENQELLLFADAFFGKNANVRDANSSRNNLRKTLINSTRSELGFDPLSKPSLTRRASELL